MIVNVCAHLSCRTVGGSFNLNTEMCVCMSRAGARLTHRVLLPPTGQTQNRNPPTRSCVFSVCVCVCFCVSMCVLVKHLEKEKVNNDKISLYFQYHMNDTHGSGAMPDLSYIKSTHNVHISAQNIAQKNKTKKTTAHESSPPS